MTAIIIAFPINVVKKNQYLNSREVHISRNGPDDNYGTSASLRDQFSHALFNLLFSSALHIRATNYILVMQSGSHLGHMGD